MNCGESVEPRREKESRRGDKGKRRRDSDEREPRERERERDDGDRKRERREDDRRDQSRRNDAGPPPERFRDRDDRQIRNDAPREREYRDQEVERGRGREDSSQHRAPEQPVALADVDWSALRCASAIPCTSCARHHLCSALAWPTPALSRASLSRPPRGFPSSSSPAPGRFSDVPGHHTTNPSRPHPGPLSTPRSTGRLKPTARGQPSTPSSAILRRSSPDSEPSRRERKGSSTLLRPETSVSPVSRRPTVEQRRISGPTEGCGEGASGDIRLWRRRPRTRSRRRCRGTRTPQRRSACPRSTTRGTGCAFTRTGPRRHSQVACRVVSFAALR